MLFSPFISLISLPLILLLKLSCSKKNFLLELCNNCIEGGVKLKLNSFFKELNSKFLKIFSNFFWTCFEGEFISMYAFKYINKIKYIILYLSFIYYNSSKNLKINLNLKNN